MYFIKIILLSLFISFSYAEIPSDVNLTKKPTKAELLLQEIKKDPTKIQKIEKKEKIKTTVNVSNLIKEIEIKTIIADGYLHKTPYFEIIQKLKAIQINDFSKKYIQEIKKIKSKKTKAKAEKLLNKLIEKDKNIIELKNSLINEMEKIILQNKTFVEDFKLNYLIDYINKEYPNEYINAGKIGVFGSLFLIFVILGFLFNRGLYTFFFKVCDFKKDDPDEDGEQAELKRDLHILKFPIFFLFISIGIQLGIEILKYPDPLSPKTHLVFQLINAVNIAIILVRSVDVFFFVGLKKEYIKIKRFEILNLFIRVVKVLIVAILIFYVLTLFGFNTNKLLASLGIGSLAIAYATKDFISRFFSGLKLILDNSFSPGDWVKINTIPQEGSIVDIGFMNTTIRTFDNALLVIPNSIITNESYINWDRRKIGRKIGMKIGVKYDSKREDIKNAISDIKEMLATNMNISPTTANFSKKRVSSGKVVAVGDELGLKNTLYVNLSEFGDSAIIIDVYAFSRSVMWGEWREVKEEIMFKIMEILEKNNLEFAFPSQSIYIEENKSKFK